MRIIIVGNKNNNEDLKKYLNEEGYKIVAEVYDGFDAIKVCRQHNPDAILMEVDIPLLDGISAARVINNEDIAGTIVFLLNDYNKNTINKLKKVGARGCIYNPIDKKHLISIIEFAIYTGNEYRTIKREKESIQQKFEDRKAIDKAKGILMINEKLTEDEAYSKIRKYSMEKRVSMREIAEFIVISNEFKN